MAEIDSIFISIDVYSASLDKLMRKFDRITGAMFLAIGSLSSSADKILLAGDAANSAASMMQNLGEAASKTVSDMQATGKSLSDASKNIQEAGKAADSAASKMQDFGDAASKTISDMQETGKSLDSTSKRMKETGDAAEKATGHMLEAGDTLKGVTESFRSTGKDIGGASKELLDASKNIGGMNKSLDKTEDSSSKAGSKVKNLMGIFKGLGNITKAFDLSDSVAMSNKKLNDVNDGKQTNKALHGNVAAAALNSRSNYKDMAGYVSKLSGAGGAFKSNDQTIAFTELMQKAIVAGGTDDRTGAMNQMIDTLSKGNLGSEDLKAASGASPLIMKSLESYTGKSSDDLYKMADNGEITANDIKNAMFSMSSDINKQFDGTQMTFGETWDKLKEGALQAASGILEKLNEIVSNPMVQQFIDYLIAGMNMLRDAVSGVCDFIVVNWNIIGPILGFIGGVALVSIMTSLWGMIPLLWSMVQPVIAQAAAWLTVNWPILLIVGALTAVIAILVNMGVSFGEVCGAIGGFLGLVAATAYNAFVSMWNGAAAFINFFGNAFHNAITNIKILFLDLALNALKNITDLANGFSSFISELTGKKINIAAGITGITDALSSEKAKATADLGDKVYVKDKTFMDTNEAIANGTKNGNDFGLYVNDKLDAINKKFANNTTKDPGDSANYGYQPYDGSKNIVGDNTAPLKVEGTGPGGSMNVSMPDEDKAYLKNIAERDYIANVSTNSLAPNISVQFGDVHQTADANKVAGRIKKILREQIAMASEGVY